MASHMLNGALPDATARGRPERQWVIPWSGDFHSCGEPLPARQTPIHLAIQGLANERLRGLKLPGANVFQSPKRVSTRSPRLRWPSRWARTRWTLARPFIRIPLRARASAWQRKWPMAAARICRRRGSKPASTLLQTMPELATVRAGFAVREVRNPLRLCHPHLNRAPKR